MNPLKLDSKSRRFYEALVDLKATHVDEEEWLTQFRLVKRIKQIEGKTVISGWRCFYEQNNISGLPLSIAERFY